MSFHKTALMVALAVSGCTQNTGKHTTHHDTDMPTLMKIGTTEGLSSPESVILSQDETFYYVSNVNGEGNAKDGNGYISRITLEGDLIDEKWATDMDAPKGLSLRADTLFVSDIDRLAVINTANGEIMQTIPFEGAGFLNDVLALPDTVLVSDSANARIYAYDDDGTVSVWMENERLGGVNGLHLHDGKILVTTMAAGELLSVDPETKTITPLAGDMKNADGIGVLSDGSYIISSWPGVLHHVSQDGQRHTLLDTQDDNIYYNDLLLTDDGLLVVPNWQPGTLTRFKVN